MIVKCPSCGAQLRVGDEHVGKTLKCPKCQGQFQAPQSVQQPVQSTDPLEQLASVSSATRQSDAHRSATRTSTRKSKVPKIIGVVAAIVVIYVLVTVFSGRGGSLWRTDAKDVAANPQNYAGDTLKSRLRWGGSAKVGFSFKAPDSDSYVFSLESPNGQMNTKLLKLSQIAGKYGHVLVTYKVYDQIPDYDYGFLPTIGTIVDVELDQ